MNLELNSKRGANLLCFWKFIVHLRFYNKNKPRGTSPTGSGCHILPIKG